MRLCSILILLACAGTLANSPAPSRASTALPPAAIVIRNANIITVDTHFSRAQALAIDGDKIRAVGDDREISRFIGPKTHVIDAKGKTVLPGLYDSHVHSYKASVSEFGAPMPVLNSLAEAFNYIRRQAASQTAGSWIILERVYPTRMKEG